MTFHMHEYFSSEYLDLRNPTKFSLHFSHFSIFFYKFSKFSAEITFFGKKQNKNKKVGGDDWAPPVRGRSPAQLTLLPMRARAPWPWPARRPGKAAAACGAPAGAA